MLHVLSLNDKNEKAFSKLFTDYYKELGCDDDCGHLLKEYVLPDLLAGLISIEVIEDGEEVAGFIIYQIDGIENEWNFKEGFGDVREIYVVPSRRRNGLGKLMLYTAELKMKERGAEKSYCLPYEGAVPFFTACGYLQTEEYSNDLDCPVFEKQNLDNTCKHCK
ncbi:MAG: GNAT family N-acetyltransferase [Clostridia bacterium]|nr:GNAT family N-acetyltransferase [Clostridia bacterium]